MRSIGSKPLGPVPLNQFVRLAVVSQLVLAVPFVLTIWVLGAPVNLFLGMLIGPFFVIGAPLLAVFSWMVAKGSNWTNTSAAATVVAGHAVQIYVLLSAILVVIRYAGLMTWWMYVVTLLVVVLGRRLLIKPYAQLMLRWLAPGLLREMQHETA